MAKTYSMTIKGQRVDFTDADLNAIKNGTAKPAEGTKVVHLFSKTGRVDVPKADFEAHLVKAKEANKAV